VPSAVLERLQEGAAAWESGLCPAAGLAWLLSGAELFVWSYRDGKDSRLRLLKLARQPAQPATVALITHGSSPAAPQAPTSALGGLAPLYPSSAADGPLSVTVCDAEGVLTVWLDAHHLALPVEQPLLAPQHASQVRRPAMREAEELRTT
jgi:hypothetical protein